MARAKKLPSVSVLDRRLANPFGAPSIPITLKTPGEWAIRIVDGTVRAGRLHDMTANKGYVFVRPDELDGSPADLGFRVVDDRVVRGEHGQEVLMKIPQADYDAIQEAKARVNLRNMGQQTTRDRVAQATSQAFGDQAADTVFSNITVQDSRVNELEPDS
jgi:hypothetical protein